MTTATDIINESLVLIGGNQPPVTGNFPSFDTSVAGRIAAQVYASCVTTVGRQFGWDFARNTVLLALSGNAAPFPWSLEYVYPTNAVQLWQVLPSVLADPNDPVPITWAVANAVVGGSQVKVIHTNQATASAVINDNPNENVWDSLFRAAVVRLLASYLAMGDAGKPDLQESMLQSGSAFETLGETRDS